MAAVGTTAVAVGGEAVTVGAALAAGVGVGVVVTAVGVAVAGADRPRSPWAIPRGPEINWWQSRWLPARRCSYPQTPLDALPVHFADVQESDDELNC